MKKQHNHGFTLIELSIVLVIIGLIVGGILVGKDLIRAAQVRAQLSQIEQIRLATNTFEQKYKCLPGDCATAESLGFSPRGTNEGEGDGNGAIYTSCNVCASLQSYGESAVFWRDLSEAKLIPNNFSMADSAVMPTDPQIDSTTSPSINDLLPQGKLPGSYLYIYYRNGLNYIGLAGIKAFYNNEFNAEPNLLLLDAYMIDSKIDDGKQDSGKVNRIFISFSESLNVGLGDVYPFIHAPFCSYPGTDGAKCALSIVLR